MKINSVFIMLSVLSLSYLFLGCYTTLWMSLSGANCCSISLIMPLVSGVAGLNASSSNKADTLNIFM